MCSQLQKRAGRGTYLIVFLFRVREKDPDGTVCSFSVTRRKAAIKGRGGMSRSDRVWMILRAIKKQEQMNVELFPYVDIPLPS